MLAVPARTTALYQPRAAAWATSLHPACLTDWPSADCSNRFALEVTAPLRRSNPRAALPAEPLVCRGAAAALAAASALDIAA